MKVLFLIGMKLKEQTKKSMFYEVTLEQRWEKIFECVNAGRGNGDERTVLVDVAVEAEDVRVAGRRAVRDEGGAERAVYFTSCQHGEKEEVKVGLSMEVVERMKWEQERVGWVIGDCEGRVRVERVEEFDGLIWTRFVCYVLVESFVLKRMDSMTVVLTYNFKHTHKISCKWD